MSVLRLRRWAPRLALSLLATAASLWLAEAALRLLFDARTPRQRAAAAAGVAYDSRSRLEVVRADRAAGRATVPALYPSAWLDQGGVALGDGRRVLPSAGIPHADTVLCNESGAFARYRADRFGLRNPDAVWDAEVDVVLLGDSYAHGSCVDDGDDIAGQLRARGLAVVNLGYGGHGPLLVLRSLQEHGRRLRRRAERPPLAVWLFFAGNDFGDLRRERRVMAGWPGAAPEGPAAAQRGEAAMRAALELRLAAEAARSRLPAWLRLGRLQALAQRARDHARAALAATTPVADADIAALAAALTAAKAAVGGQLVVARVPRWERLVAGSVAGDALPQALRAAAARAGVTLLDLEPALRAVGDPSLLYPFGVHGHFNPRGYAVVAEALAALAAPAAPPGGTPGALPPRTATSGRIR